METELLLLIASLLTVDSTIDWCRRMGLLAKTPPLCPLCERNMTQVRDNTVQDGYRWRCPDHKGRKMTIRYGSFFERSHVPLPKLVVLLYLWSFQMPIVCAVQMTGISEATLIDWYNFIREVCSTHLMDFPDLTKIGGPGHIVCLDESVIAKRKYHVGRLVRERWIFGGFDRNTRRGFIRMVDDRTAATLLPLIAESILPGTEIWSDGWASYAGITNMPGLNYTHRVVNHTLHFVDPATGCCTNPIELYWKNCKMGFKRMSGTTSVMLPSHLDEFMFRQLYGGTDRGEVFRSIVNTIKYQYPCP